MLALDAALQDLPPFERAVLVLRDVLGWDVADVAELLDVPPAVVDRTAPEWGVAYDEDLADRIRELLAPGPPVTERKMFGGLAFLVGGNMAVAASGQGGLLVRVDPASSDRLVETTNARPMEMRGREMQGWLRVASEDVRTKRALSKWVGLGTGYAGSLPRKP